MAIPTKKGPQVQARQYSLPAQRTPRPGGYRLLGEGFTDLGVGLQKLGGGVANVEKQYEANLDAEKRKADDARVNDAVSEANGNLTTRMVGDAAHEKARQSAEVAWAEDDGVPVSRGEYSDESLTEEQLLSAGGGTPSSAEGEAIAGARADSMVERVRVDEQVAELYARREQPGGVRGFLATKGVSASQFSAETLQVIEKDRVRIRKGLANDEQRQLFDAKTAHLYAGARDRVERHTQAQNELTVAATSKALQESALVAVAAEPGDDDVAAGQMAVVEADIRQNALSPAVAKAEVQAFRNRVAEVRVRQFMSTRDWQSAKKVLEESKGNLSPQNAEKFSKDVGQLELEVKGESMAQAAIRVSRLPNGKVDEVAAGKYIDAQTDAGLDLTTGKEFPVDLKQRTVAKGVLKALVRVDDAQWEDDTKAVVRASGSIYAESKNFYAIPVEMRTELRKRDYETYLKLERDLERWAIERSKAARSNEGDARRMQDMANDLAKLDYQQRPQSERLALDVKSSFAASGADARGLGEIAALQTKEKEAYDKGLTGGEDAFVDRVMAKADRFLASRFAGQPKDLEAARRDAKALARREFTKAALRGEKPLSLEESDKLEADAVSGVISTATTAGGNERRYKSKPARPNEPAEPTGPAAKVEVTDGKSRGLVPADKVDAWLAAHPGWKRKGK